MNQELKLDEPLSADCERLIHESRDTLRDGRNVLREAIEVIPLSRAEYDLLQKFTD